MMILVVGATGATGRLLVQQLLGRGQTVKVIVRSPERLPEATRSHEGLSVVHADLLDLADAELAQHVKGCAAVASCLGHTLSWKGIYGRPRGLVGDATRRLCDAIAANRPQRPTKFVLMNTAGNSNRDLHEPQTLGERVVIGLVRALLPPHVDNERAADYLRVRIGRNHAFVEWVVVRPDTLIDENEVTAFELHPSPIRSSVFNAGKTSRVNVGDFMATLITDDDLWHRWRGQMPVIYNTQPGIA